MEIKTTLKKLIALFAQSASTEELTMPVRQFAAQLTILTAHLERVEAKIDARTKALAETMDGHVAELASHIMAVRAGAAPSNAAAAAAAAAPQPNGGGSATEEEPADLSEDEATAAMVAQVQRETEAEALAIAKAPAPAAVTPLRKTNAGGKKAPNAGDAA